VSEPGADKHPPRKREDDLPEVVLYADGACSGNPGPGGWAAILYQPATGRKLEISDGEAETTNNRMEMTAVVEGLLRLKGPSRVRIVSDSQYVINGLKNWVHGWQRNGWKTSDRKPVKNRELWEELLRLSRIHRLEFEWTEGHSGHPENERCDQLAVAAYQKYLKTKTGRVRKVPR
jgi:ribonuclease HI